MVFWPAELRLRAPVLELSGSTRVELGSTRIGIDFGRLLDGVAEVRRLDVDGPVRWVHKRGELVGQLSLELTPGDSPVAWSLSADIELDSGGRLEVRGGLAGGGRFAGIVEIEDVASEPFGVFLSDERGQAAGVSGRYSGRLDASDPTAPPTLRLASDGATVDLPPVLLEGPVVLVAELPPADSSDPNVGRFAIDATRARVEYAGGAAKAFGRGASVTGGIVREPNGQARIEDVRLKVLRFEGEIPAP